MKRYGFRSVFHKLIGLFMLGSLLWGGQASIAQERVSRLVWSKVAGLPASVDLSSVFMVDQNNAWAAGRDGDTGVTYRFELQNGRWVAQRSATFGQPLNDIAVAPDGTAWVVGEDGLIAHSLTRGQWSLTQPVPGASLQTIQILGNDQQRWVGGTIPRPGSEGEPVLLSSTGGDWARDMAVTGEGQIESLHFVADGGWAVGGNHIWRYTQGHWQAETAPPPCGDVGCVGGFSAVRAISADQAWAVGSRIGLCAICSARPYAIHRENGNWSVILPDQPISGWTPDPTPLNFSGLSDITFINRDFGIAVGSWFDSAGRRGSLPLVIKYERGAWSAMELPPVGNALQSISAINETHALTVGKGGLLLAYGYGPQGDDPPPGGNPTARVPDPQQPGIQYTSETGHSIRGAFLRYWQANGGLAQFGYPVTEEFREANPDDGSSYTVQYFERARFEYHPELAGTRYEVLLGLLGRTVTGTRTQEDPFLAKGPSTIPGSRYYAKTGHTMAPQFINRWDRTGGLAVYGYPISEPFYEVSPTDHQTYLVQYFERNRFEYHPELAGTHYEVLFGLLGSEVLRGRGWMP